MTHKTTWTNADGLVVGFGPNKAEYQKDGVVKAFGSVKEAVLDFTYESSAPSISIPAGSEVVGVELHVTETWATLTAVTVGDGGASTGFITATEGAAANLLAGAVIQAAGSYVVSTGSLVGPRKKYAAADTIDVAFTGSAPTAGKARLVVRYAGND